MCINAFPHGGKSGKGIHYSVLTTLTHWENFPNPTHNVMPCAPEAVSSTKKKKKKKKKIWIRLINDKKKYVGIFLYTATVNMCIFSVIVFDVTSDFNTTDK